MIYDRQDFLAILMDGASVRGLEALLSVRLYGLADQHRTLGVVRPDHTETERQAAVLRRFLMDYEFLKEETDFLHLLLAELEL